MEVLKTIAAVVGMVALIEIGLLASFVLFLIIKEVVKGWFGK